MISHVVLMSPREDLADADRRAFVESFERAVAEIPSVRSVRVGRRVLMGAGYEKSGTTADFLAIIDFDTVEGLESYLRHPAHADLGARFTASLASAEVYDFETGGIEMVAAWLPPLG